MNVCANRMDLKTGTIQCGVVQMCLLMGEGSGVIKVAGHTAAVTVLELGFVPEMRAMLGLMSSGCCLGPWCSLVGFPETRDVTCETQPRAFHMAFVIDGGGGGSLRLAWGQGRLSCKCPGRGAG